jgi:hypothetical protein
LLIKRGFLASAECEGIIGGFQQLDSAPPLGAESGGGLRRHPNRTEILAELFERRPAKEITHSLSKLCQVVLDDMRIFFGSSDLQVEFTLLTELRVGDSHPLHADNEQQADNGQWVPNHTPWRAYAAMVYLNTSGVDYKGGVLHFPALGQTVAPQVGELVGFSCGHEHEHEVTPIEEGRRYSISIWLTRKIGHAERWT